MKTCPQCKNNYPDNLEFCSIDNAPLIPRRNSHLDPMIGKELAGRFVLSEKIGQGGMGTVYKALHTRMNRICAIKLLISDTDDIESAAARFNREAQMASKIDNPHAVVIYDFGEADGGLLYLAMEYIEGEPLSSLLGRERRLAVSRAVNITGQISEALAAAHSRGIVHRDLKPENIMISCRGSENDYVKVLDFGIAKPAGDDGTDNLTKTGFVVGSPAYMSPEQLSGDKLDARSDIYSLGLIVYEMLTGRLPFDGDNQQAVMIKRITSDPIPISTTLASISPFVAQVVMNALARDRNSRTPTVTRFANDLISAASQVTEESATELLSSGSGDENSPTVLIGAQQTTAESQPRTTPHMNPVAPQTSPQAGPSSFVTRASQPSAPPAATVVERQVGQPAAPTLRQQSWPPSHQINDTLVQSAAQPAQRSNKTFLVLASVMLFFLVAAIGGGYFLYSRYTNQPQGAQQDSAKAGGPSQTNAAQPADKPADAAATSASSTEAEATASYERGKQHQSRASEMEQLGSPVAVREENRQAVDEYKKAISIRPNFPEAHLNLGVALYSLNKMEEAAAEYKTAIDQLTQAYGAPSSAAMSNYALALFDLQRYREAADAFGQALKIDPKDYDLYAHRGFAFQNSGDLEKAKADYNDYLHLAPAGRYAAVVKEILAGRVRPPADTGNH